MCTLTIAWRVFEEAPVVVASNRDEALDRPSESPALFEENSGIVAPRDSRAGGTWVGYNEFGLFVGITNRWVEGPPGERSRGHLVVDCLRQPDAETAARHVERSVTEYEYEGFNIVLADQNAAFLLEWDGYLDVHQLDPGVHVVVNVGAALGGGGHVEETFFVPEQNGEIGRQQMANARDVRAALAAEPGETATAWLDRARSVIADHKFGVCVHGDGYGTRSSSLISLGSERTYEFAAGPPCTTPYRRIESQV